MSNSKYDALKLENQLCFPLYAAAKEIIRQYKPFLDEIDLTYTQYIAMMLLWEKQTMSVKEMGEALYLDSGTLTPLLKRLESKSLVMRVRSVKDERILNITLTDAGVALKDRALNIPEQIAKCSRLTPEEAFALHHILYKLLGKSED